MAYATLMHVEAKNTSRGSFGAESKPSATQVILMIHQAAAEMDMALGRAGYGVPIPMGTSSVPTAVQVHLEHVNALGAAYMVECAAQVPTDKKDFLGGQWGTALRIMNSIELPGLARDSAQSLPRTNSVATPFFTREMDL